MSGSSEVQRLQEFEYAAGYEYRRDSPHLKHPRLNNWMSSALREEVRLIDAAGLPLTVLEIGAGDGAFVESLLAIGAAVTATEMSRPSIDLLRTRYSLNARFNVEFDPDGEMASLGDSRYAIVLYASVLHHIPDYQAALAKVCDRHLLPGGSLISFQDPMWYASLAPGVRMASEAMYLSWRLTRGQWLRGLASRWRRRRNDLRAEEPSDMVEYHVVRNGVDQGAIARLLQPRFRTVEVTGYWSAHATLWQFVGEHVGLRNTFAVRARGLGSAASRLSTESAVSDVNALGAARPRRWI